MIVDKLDPEAILIRGYPKPIVMSTGLNPMVDAMMIVGAHANAGSMGIIAHSYAVDSFTTTTTFLGNAAASQRMRLTVGFSQLDNVPEPSTVALSTVGLIGAAGFARRHRRA